MVVGKIAIGRLAGRKNPKGKNTHGIEVVVEVNTLRHAWSFTHTIKI